MEAFFNRLQSGVVDLHPAEMALRLCIVVALSCLAAGVYSKTYRGYGRPSQMTLVLVLIAFSTCGIIMGIGNNLALSLGMVGALSIVRFRAAVKDNRDLAYLFWTLSMGLVCGAGSYALTGLLACGALIVLVLETWDPFRAVTRSYLVILSHEPAAPDLLELLPPGAELKASVLVPEAELEESTYLVHLGGDPKALASFRARVAERANIKGCQILSPEDSILG